MSALRRTTRHPGATAEAGLERSRNSAADARHVHRRGDCESTASSERSVGEVWWVELDEPRPVVILGGDEASGFQVIQVVPASGMDISGLGVEVPIGAVDGLAYDGVVRLAFPHPEFLFCTWLTIVTTQSLIKRAAVLPPGRLDQIDEAIRLCSQPRVPSAEATARLGEIREALRRGRLGSHASTTRH